MSFQAPTYSNGIYVEYASTESPGTSYRTFFECSDCGALVPAANVEKHNKFHERLHRQACRT